MLKGSLWKGKYLILPRVRQNIHSTASQTRVLCNYCNPSLLSGWPQNGGPGCTLKENQYMTGNGNTAVCTVCLVWIKISFILCKSLHWQTWLLWVFFTFYLTWDNSIPSTYTGIKFMIYLSSAAQLVSSSLYYLIQIYCSLKLKSVADWEYNLITYCPVHFLQPLREKLSRDKSQTTLLSIYLEVR